MPRLEVSTLEAILNPAVGTHHHCRILREAGEYIGQWSKDQPKVKEESITDWLLYEISKKVSYVKYIAFTRHEEARKTGADWEWWFVFPNGGWRFRVQAKRLRHTGDNYASLADTNRHGLQIEKLISDCAAANAIPLYAFYNSSQPVSGAQCSSIGSTTGAFVSDAEVLYTRFIRRGKKVVDGSHILSRSIPMHCLMCCPYVGDLGTMSPINTDFFLSRGPHNDSRDNGNNREPPDGSRGPDDYPDRDPNQGFHEIVPNFVLNFLQLPSEEVDIVNIPNLTDVQALMIFDMRREQPERMFEVE